MERNKHLDTVKYSNCNHCRICSGYQIERNKMGWACGTMRERRGVYRALVGKTEGNRQLGTPRRRWEDNIKMGLQEVGCGVVGTGSSWFMIRTGDGYL
jgi:hypothetical protein